MIPARDREQAHWKVVCDEPDETCGTTYHRTLAGAKNHATIHKHDPRIVELEDQ